MKVAATLTKLLVVCFVFAAVFGQPLIDVIHRELPPRPDVVLPVAGDFYQVAGQQPNVEPAPDTPQITLRAKKLCEVGELLRLDATESTVDGLTWQIIPKTNDFEVIENGRRAFFSSRTPGSEYLVILAGAKDGKAYLKHHKIRVRGELPAPGPKTIDLKISEWLDLVPESEFKKEDAIRVATAFEETASKLQAGEMDVDNMLEATAVANVVALGERLEDWKAFLTELGTEMQIYVDSGQLETREQFLEVWATVAKGLRQATE